MSANLAWNIVNFRSALVRQLVAEGYEVLVAAGEDATAPALRAMGVRLLPLPMASRSISPFRDGWLFLRFCILMRRERPDLFLGWTIKPNIYGSLAAALFGVAVVNNISGLGTAFLRGGWLARIARQLYRIGLRRSTTVFFQNAEDRDLFLADGMVGRQQSALLPGSGIDTDVFAPGAYSRSEDGIFRFLLVARLIGDKGVHEYVAAARAVRARHPGARFQIMGFLDVDNRTAISRTTLEAWVAEGVIDYLGQAEDVRPALVQADCIVLPSYREGTSRVLLEAAAMARPAITSDVPGCRDVVRDGITGLVCRPRDPDDLASKMDMMINLDTVRRQAMGQAAREDVVARFSDKIVVDRYRNTISTILVRRSSVGD